MKVIFSVLINNDILIIERCINIDLVRDVYASILSNMS